MGVGDIGFTVAKAFKFLGMEVYGLATTLKDPNVITTTYMPDNLKDFLEKCDYICNILPSTPSTLNLLSGNALEPCKIKCPGFVNVGRSDIITDNDLLNALKSKWISSAYLDVFNTEPLPQTSPLWTTENIHITPHVAGVNDTYHKTFLANLERYIQHQSLKYVFNWDKLY